MAHFDLYIIRMLLYCFVGGLSIGFALDFLEKKKRVYFGIAVMYAIFAVLLMARLTFRYFGGA